MTQPDSNIEEGLGAERLTKRQAQVLDFVRRSVAERGFPPSVREIGAALSLTSPSTVHAHLSSLERLGYLSRDASKPRALALNTSPGHSAGSIPAPHTALVPLIGQVAAGTGVIAEQSFEDLVPMPQSFTGDGELFMVAVRGHSMIEAGILDGDFVVARVQPTANSGELVVAGLDENEATVKRLRITGDSQFLDPANPDFDPIEITEEHRIYGRVVTVMRRC